MLRISLAANALALILATPAFTQNTQNTMSAPTAAPPPRPAGSMRPDNTSSMTCDQMMAQAQSASASSSGARMAMAQQEISMAQMAQAKNDDATCKMHAMKAMNALK